MELTLDDFGAASVEPREMWGLRGVRIVFPEPWVASQPEFEPDAVEQLWTHRAGENTVTALVRQANVASWSLSVTITNEAPEAVAVPACQLVFDSDWPPIIWLAGALGYVVGAPRDDGRVLVLRQIRGSSRLSEGRLWLTDLPVILGPAGTGGSQYRVHWRGEWFSNHRAVASLLPVWWPERTALESADLVGLSLPDAAITAAGVQLLEDEDVVWLSARDGRHLAQVHSGVGTQDVHLWWAPTLRGELGTRAARILETDPRLASGVDAWLVVRAMGWRVGLHHEVAGEWLTQACEEVASRVARGRDEGLFAVAALAQAATVFGESDFYDAAERALRGLAPAAGIALAQIAIRVAGVSFTFEEADLRPPGFPKDRVERALFAAEIASLSQASAPPPAAWLVGSLLGSGLPGETTDHLTRAKACCLLSHAPERWDLTLRWPVPLHVVLEDARNRLLAEECNDEAFAWLVWTD